ncbi:hypothetical protein N7462_010595 [Penicillium macrosclerotiorum]|uniref:uncharacterized protein n=1 Tax=Penicillium macrosclerotiorum TaxID=303699 RepID=UPI002547786C|nr:uncharacterized protein N7462_010595 [Penicillium macrosclerotiorum]KAJ5669525.1 hypothetical protein N7462_010595 [Penicillium macrosclerotiorum]
MVGVPHSTGCALCRKRHIKCDESIPGCSQCRRYGRPCPGYRRIFRFQDEGPSFQQRRRSMPRGKSRGAPWGLITFSAPSSIMSISVRDDGNIEEVQRKENNSAAALGLCSPFILFIALALPGLRFIITTAFGPDFAEYVVKLIGKDQYLDAAISCLGAVYMARVTENPILLRNSREMYGISLRGLFRALSNPDQALSDSMLFATMMLSAYEMYARTKPEAWVIHADASRRLVEARGPKLHKSGFGRLLWSTFRGFYIATAIYQGKACFLDEEEWRQYTRQFMAEDAQKPGEWACYSYLSDSVFMEAVKCPGYVAEAREMLSDLEKPDPEATHSLMHRIAETSETLHRLSLALRSTLNAHAERQRGIIQRPESFIGPAPELFPDTGPSLVVNGADDMQAALQQLCDLLQDQLRIEDTDALSPETTTQTPSSDGSAASPALSHSIPKACALPLRISSELGRGPLRVAEHKDSRTTFWLDCIGSSMGMLGTRIVEEDKEEDYRASLFDGDTP